MLGSLSLGTLPPTALAFGWRLIHTSRVIWLLPSPASTFCCLSCLCGMHVFDMAVLNNLSVYLPCRYVSFLAKTVLTAGIPAELISNHGANSAACCVVAEHCTPCYPRLDFNQRCTSCCQLVDKFLRTQLFLSKQHSCLSQWEYLVGASTGVCDQFLPLLLATHAWLLDALRFFNDVGLWIAGMDVIFENC